MNVTISFTWTTKTPLRIHTGLARAGSVDRAVRARDGRPVLPGEAVKASIREAAERILRWQGKNTVLEKKDSSIPTHPALFRLFAPHSAGANSPSSSARYFYRSALASKVPDDLQNGRMEITSTAIDDERGTSEDNMLRSFELWRPGIQFGVTIKGTGGDWSESKPDRNDLSLLLMSIAAVDVIGGGWGIGCGELSISNLKYQIHGPVTESEVNAVFPDSPYVKAVIDAIESDVAAEASV